MTTIGIVGQGFVGGALREGMEKACSILTYDKYKTSASNVNSIYDMCKGADLVFVCVPTPMKKTGECDTRIVEDVVNEVAAGFGATKRTNGKPSIVIKSTVPPGTTKRLQEQHKHVYVIFQPEFLTEANAVNDFKNQNRIVIGGDGPLARGRTKQLFEKAFPYVPILETSSTAAELVKYTTNCFLSMKVSFANEMYQICQKLDVQWDRVWEIARYDKRLGDSHWKVPGPDGQFGFGGHCFPKDLRALLFVCEQLDIDSTMLESTWHKNNLVREERDWEKMKGRAVSED